MSTLSGSRLKVLYAVIAVAVFLSAFFKIADLDFWWHLKTGQIIVQEKEFQHTEIYSYTAPGRPYIDHEWLFQVIQYLCYSVAGPLGVILLKCSILIVIYLLITRFLLQQQVSVSVIITLIFLSIAGGRTRFIERPEIFTELFLLCCYLLIHSYLLTGKMNRLVAMFPIMLVWANVHAAVILGFMLMGSFIAGSLLEKVASRYDYPSYFNAGNRRSATLIAFFVVSFLITGINPDGFRMHLVPFELTGIIESGLLNNQEWQQPPAWRLPFFYAGILLTFTVFVLHARNLHIVNFLFAALLGYIGLKYVRNIALFSIFMPVLIAPHVRNYQPRFKNALPLLWSASLAWTYFFSPFEFGSGISSHFPDRIVQFTKEKNLQGNMLNSYAFGGYLIWTAYPERKIFIDGRNEVFLPFLEEIMKVRADGRLWKQFLEKYRIEYALLNYWDELEEVTIMDTSNKAIKSYAPFSSTHFPRSAWALVYWDDNGMIFIKRAGLNGALASIEYREIFPEGHSYQQNLIKSGRINKDKAVEEIQRKLQEQPDCKRAGKLLDEISEIQ